MLGVVFVPISCTLFPQIWSFSLLTNKTLHVNLLFPYCKQHIFPWCYFSIFVGYNDVIFLSMANWGKHWRILLDALLFFKCCSLEQGYGMNIHANQSKIRMKNIDVTLCVLLQALLLHHDVVICIVVTPRRCYRLLLLHLGCRYKVAII